jgi:hypothetical protein
MNNEHSVEDMTGEELENTVNEEHQATQPEAKPLVMGIGQFAKHLILNTTLSNDEILQRVRKVFPNANTGPASIAWYKSALRKKGLLGAKSGAKTVTLSQEQLEELMK